MHDRYLARVAISVAVVFLCCRLLVVENLGLVLAGAGLLGVALFTLIVARTPPHH